MSSKKLGNEAGGLSGGNPSSLLQECFACGVLVVGARKRIVACTAEAAEHLHRDAAKLLNAPLSSLPAPLARLIQETARSGKAILNREIPLGQATALRASILPVKTREPMEIVVVLNSLTSTPVFEQNLRRLDRLAGLGTLSASMAHEIKNGMVAIKTFVDLLAQKGQDTELTEVVGRELERINGIVTQMLRFGAANRSICVTIALMRSNSRPTTSVSSVSWPFCASRSTNVLMATMPFLISCAMLAESVPRPASRSSRRRFCSKTGVEVRLFKTTTISTGSRVFTGKMLARNAVGMAQGNFAVQNRLAAPGGFLNQSGQRRGQRTQGRVQQLRRVPVQMFGGFGGAGDDAFARVHHDARRRRNIPEADSKGFRPKVRRAFVAQFF